jgi:hypothetical protein
MGRPSSSCFALAVCLALAACGSNDGSMGTAPSVDAGSTEGAADGPGNDSDDSDSGQPSNDGVTWGSQSSGTTNSLRDVTYGAGVFVAVGGYGSIVTSPDGTTWTVQASGSKADLFAVAFANGIFVAAGSEGTILTSPDGATWTHRLGPSQWMFASVAFGDGLFVAMSRGGDYVTSPDGIVWSQSSNLPLYGAELDHMVFARSLFVGAGLDTNNVTTGAIFTSPDSRAWTERASGLAAFNAIAFGGEQFVVAGESGIILTSPDGATWTNRRWIPGQDPPPAEYLKGVAYGNGRFVIAGGNAAGAEILASSDGAVWTTEIVSLTTWLEAITFGAGEFVAVGDQGSIAISK